jgi:hypothetical protein
MLYTDYGEDPDHDHKYYVDAAKSCRDVRSRMSLVECAAKDSAVCVYNNLLPLLDTLQRRAYEELRLNIEEAIRYRLPTEIKFLIFEHLMETEEVPLDPRVIVRAEHKIYEDKGRKTRLVCPHVERARNAFFPTTTDRVDVLGTSYRLACGDNWNETERKFSHFDSDRRRRDNDKYAFGATALNWRGGGDTDDEDETSESGSEDNSDEDVESLGSDEVSMSEWNANARL